MIRDFLSSWPLFHNTYLAGWLAAVALAIMGVLVVARSQVFVGAALAQASTLGIALAMWSGSALGTAAPSWVESEGLLTLTAVAFAIGAALLAGGRSDRTREAREALTGWIFLLGAAASILVVARSPHGLEEVHRLLSSSLIGATATDVTVFAALAALTGLSVLRWRQTLLLWVFDPTMAAAVGVRVRLLELAFSGWLGLSVGLAIRSSGMLYTFGCLVLPALVARTLCREVGAMLLLAPLLALTAAFIGFVAANHYDFPPAQLTIALLCVLWPLAGVLRWSRRRLPP
jgi:ABC-type Mn2+/Zn2+ transport system permease subunit